MKKWIKATMIGVTALSLAACTNNTSDGNFGTNEIGNGTETPFGQMQNENYPNPRNTTNLHRQGTTSNQNQFRGNQSGNQLHQNSRVETSQEVADELTNMPNVKRAMVFLTDQNAYVGVVLDDNNDRADNRNRSFSTQNRGLDQANGDLASQIKEEISRKVKTLHPGIRNVYVSASPGFLNSLNDYTADLEEGRPLSGLVEEFNEMVERIFPANATEMSNNNQTNQNNLRRTR